MPASTNQNSGQQALQQSEQAMTAPIAPFPQQQQTSQTPSFGLAKLPGEDAAGAPTP